MDDVVEVIGHLKSIGRNAVGIVGHSRGATVALYYASRVDDPCLRVLVLVSGRFFMPAGPLLHLKESLRLLDAQGYFDWNANVRGHRRMLRITQEMVASFSEADPKPGKL